ncbi:hypothetical protein [Burkholderia ambifaria]|uniref:hypothetical protein n=1 Tax=Burkholderia ambifaria TaxID=152480 RepID=UPI00158BAE9E|nr:hypothetical protein [Burkholderia ambifaria]
MDTLLERRAIKSNLAKKMQNIDKGLNVSPDAHPDNRDRHSSENRDIPLQFRSHRFWQRQSSAPLSAQRSKETTPSNAPTDCLPCSPAKSVYRCERTVRVREAMSRLPTIFPTRNRPRAGTLPAAFPEQVHDVSIDRRIE